MIYLVDQTFSPSLLSDFDVELVFPENNIAKPLGFNHGDGSLYSIRRANPQAKIVALCMGEFPQDHDFDACLNHLLNIKYTQDDIVLWLCLTGEEQHVEKFQQLKAKIQIIAPSGNNGHSDTLLYPSSLPGVISVGAATKEGVAANFSNTPFDVMCTGTTQYFPADPDFDALALPEIDGVKHNRLAGTSIACAYFGGFYTSKLDEWRTSYANEDIICSDLGDFAGKQILDSHKVPPEYIVPESEEDLSLQKQNLFGAGSIFKKAPTEVSTERWNICNACEFFGGIVCKKCGCLMKLKVHLNNASCPIGKWPR